jgi:hypothetical protein
MADQRPYYPYTFSDSDFVYDGQADSGPNGNSK